MEDVALLHALYKSLRHPKIVIAAVSDQLHTVKLVSVKFICLLNDILYGTLIRLRFSNHRSIKVSQSLLSILTPIPANLPVISHCIFSSISYALYSFIFPDLPSVTEYLLDLYKAQVYHLAISLGLSRTRAKNLRDSSHETISFLDDVITAWLQRVDQVDERGGPTWRTLVDALRSRRLGHNGIADKIEREQVI